MSQGGLGGKRHMSMANFVVRKRVVRPKKFPKFLNKHQ